MSRPSQRGFSPQQLRLFLFGWLGLSAVAAICVFAIILIAFGDQPSGGAQSNRQPTARPVIVSPATQLSAQLPTSGAPGDSEPTPRSLQDDGKFALGGQIQPYQIIAHRELMWSAGMSWIKFQIVWKPGMAAREARDLVIFGHQQGFRVLVSVKGELNPTSIDFADYIDFINRLVSDKPDAVEVWNEMNFDKEWPANDINGASYVTKMLAPAYQAIKAKSPETIVITGAPTPTGAFGGSCGSIDTGVSVVSGCDDNYYLQQMRDAGAANYADCIGVHFNSGATSPSAVTGHPNDDGKGHYSWYYQPMVNLYANMFNKPLCFTELGYVSSEGFGVPPVNFPWATKVSAAQQAQWLAETVSLARKSGKARLLIVWNVDFPSDAPDDPKSMYAIIRSDDVCLACDPLWAAMTAP